MWNGNLINEKDENVRRSGGGRFFMSLSDTLYVGAQWRKVGPKSAPGSQMTLIFYLRGPKNRRKSPKDLKYLLWRDPKA